MGVTGPHWGGTRVDLIGMREEDTGPHWYRAIGDGPHWYSVEYDIKKDIF